MHAGMKPAWAASDRHSHATPRFLKWRSTGIAARGAGEEKASDLTLLGCPVNPGAIAQQDLPDEAQIQAARMAQELLAVQNPAHVFGGIPVPVGSLDDRE